MTPWTWFAGELDEDVYDLAEEDTREKVIEARSSTAKKYEGSDFIPFLRTRNAEIIEVVEPS